MLKKKENSLYRVRGKKERGVYLALETALGGYLADWRWATEMIRLVEGSCSSSASSTTTGVVGLQEAGERKDLNWEKADWERREKWPRLGWERSEVAAAA